MTPVRAVAPGRRTADVIVRSPVRRTRPETGLLGGLLFGVRRARAWWRS